MALRRPPGKITAIAGPSGSGKSTLLYVLAGLQPPQAGRVLSDGADIYRLGEGRRDAWRRRTVGFVFQDFHLIPELSVVANVALPGTFGRSGGRRRAPAELLAELGVPTDRRSVAMLSRGEQQRVAIARALAFDPPVMLADEPTASLDGAAASEVRAILRRLAEDGRTVVVVSHDEALLAEADDRFASTMAARSRTAERRHEPASADRCHAAPRRRHGAGLRRADRAGGRALGIHHRPGARAPERQRPGRRQVRPHRRGAGQPDRPPAQGRVPPAGIGRAARRGSRSGG